MQAPQKKVLWLPKWYPNKYDVLDGVFTVDHAKAAAKNVDLFVLFVHSDTELKEKKKEIYTEENGFPEMTVYFRYKKIGFGPLDKILIGLKYIQTQIRAYRDVKKRWGQPDITHIHVLLRSSFLALWLKWLKGVPFFITEHWSGFDPNGGYKISWFKRWIIRFVLRRAVSTTAVSNYLLEHIKPYGPSADYLVISNAIDENKFIPLQKPQRDKKKIIHVSTMDDYPKNFGNILKSIAEVVKTEQNFELHVIGKGVEREKQEALAKELGIHNSFVIFRGYLDKEVLAEEVAESDFMILFSHYETQSCVILEALMSGVPIIVPRLGGVQELVTETNGIAVTPLSNKAFSQAIISFIREEKKYSADAIRSEAIRYGYEAIGEQFAELYARV